MRTRDTISRVGRAIGACALAGLALSALSACRGDRSEKPPRQFFPDLDDQPRWKPQGQTEFYADGRMMRLPVAGTVAFGTVSFVTQADWGAFATNERVDFLKEDARVFSGREPDGTLVARIPIPVTRALIERGQNRYNIYCVVCHGYAGDGQGMVGRQWATPVPNYGDPKYIRPDPADPKSELWKDGHLFDVARHGKYDATGTQKMPGYAHAIDERDAWAVVAYVRTLQEAQSGAMRDVPEGERAALERQRQAALEVILAEEARAAEQKAKEDKAKGAAPAPGGTP